MTWYCLFWVQHIVMASLLFKKTMLAFSESYILYDRYIYNISSGVTLWLIVSNLRPKYELLLSLPLWIWAPLTALGMLLIMKAILELGGAIMMPFSFQKIVNDK